MIENISSMIKTCIQRQGSDLETGVFRGIFCLTNCHNELFYGHGVLLKMHGKGCSKRYERFVVAQACWGRLLGFLAARVQIPSIIGGGNGMVWACTETDQIEDFAHCYNNSEFEYDKIEFYKSL